MTLVAIHLGTRRVEVSDVRQDGFLLGIEEIGACQNLRSQADDDRFEKLRSPLFPATPLSGFPRNSLISDLMVCMAVLRVGCPRFSRDFVGFFAAGLVWFHSVVFNVLIYKGL